MFRLAHLSDVHLGPLPAFDRSRLRLKQRIGQLNWRQNRAHAFDEAILEAVVGDAIAAAPDHIAVTGDLINLGLEGEAENALDWLENLGPGDRVSTVPGNHDAYVDGSLARCLASWRDYGAGSEHDFPYVRTFANAALIGVSTAIATAPLMATGRVGRTQLARLRDVLTELGTSGQCRIVLIHHPPDDGACPWHKRLLDAHDFREVVAACGAELVLCGHNHRNRTATLAGPAGDIPVHGVAAGAMRPREGRAGGSWNLVTVSGRPGDYEIDVTTRTWDPERGMIDVS